jgi:hypothetical protein
MDFLAFVSIRAARVSSGFCNALELSQPRLHKNCSHVANRLTTQTPPRIGRWRVPPKWSRKSAHTGSAGGLHPPANLDVLRCPCGRFRNFFDYFCGLLGGLAARRNIRLRNDSQQLPASIDHRNPPHLMPFHSVEGLFDIILRRTGEGVSGHNILDERAVRVPALGHHLQRQIPVCHNPQEFSALPALTHRYGSNIFRLHNFPYSGCTVARHAASRILRHYFSTIHI